MILSTKMKKKATLRVLCLHGFRANVQVMKDQMRPLQRILGHDTEFVCLHGPFEAEDEAFGGVEELYKDSRPFYEWWKFFIGDDTKSTVPTPESTELFRERMGDRGHWFIRYGGLEQALEYLHEEIEKLGPFDVAVGFSQGALMLTLFSMWSLHHFNKRFWELTVIANTTRNNGVNSKHLFVTPDDRDILVPFPSVHFIGKKDAIAAEVRLHVEIYDRFPTGSPTGRIVLEHGGGHHFPSFKKRQDLYAKLVEVMNQYRSGVEEKEETEDIKQVSRL